MLSIEEIKLLIEKLKKVKKEDLQKLIDSNLKILEDLALAIDANNSEEINRLDKTEEWFRLDLENKRQKPTVNTLIYKKLFSCVLFYCTSYFKAVMPLIKASLGTNHLISPPLFRNSLLILSVGITIVTSLLNS